MVGASRWLEELSRSMAVRGFRRILRQFIRPISREHERASGALAQRKRSSAPERHQWPPHPISRLDLDGPAPRFFANQPSLLSRFDLFQRRLRTAHTPDPALR